MTTYKFKTTLKCGGCVAAVQTSLDEMDHIKNWEVDLESTDKVLIVESDQEVKEDIEKAFRDKGFEAELISET